MTAIPQRSFARGEISKSFQARADLQAYMSGLAACVNAFIRGDGGWMNRGGLLFQDGTKDDEEVVTIPWSFDQSGNVSCFLELGAGYIRIFVRGVMQTLDSVTAWDSGTAYEIGDIASSGGVNYYCIADHTNQAPPNATYWYAMPSDILEIPTPYSLEEAQEVYWDQNQNKMIFTHGAHRPRELTCEGATSWIFKAEGTTHAYFGASISEPTGLAIDSGGTGYTYYVTKIDKTTGTEGLAASITTSAAPTSGSPRVLTWNTDTSAEGFNVYRRDGTGLGLLAFTPEAGYRDVGLDTDKSERMPTHNYPFNSESISPLTTFPSICAFSKQRLFVASISPNFSSTFGSWIGAVKNFLRKTPLLPNGSLNIPLTGSESPTVRHLLDLAGLWILTDGAEIYCKGDGYGVITPGNVNPEDKSWHGSCGIKPLKINRSALFIQADEKTIRELGPDIQQGEESDITLFAKHLFKSNVIKGWAYQKSPDPIVWMIRDDGVLIGLTYVKSQQIIAFHRHETDGAFENVCVVKEDGEHVPYFVVRRTIDGVTKRFHERLADRRFSDILDAVFMDSTLSYDGRNTDENHTLMIGGGTTWEAGEPLQLESSEAYFDADEVGNVYQIRGLNDDGEEIVINCEVTGYSSDSLVDIVADKDIPETMQATATWEWTRAVNELSGLDHLEGKEVSILADGGVIACPNDPDLTSYTVESGSLTLDRCYGVIHVGLPYISDLETLSLETLNNETMANKKVNVSQVTAYLEETRGLHFAGKLPTGDDPLEHMEELLPHGVDYSGGPELFTGKVTIPIQGEWTNDGKCAARQIYPLPATINAIVPTGFIPA